MALASLCVQSTSGICVFRPTRVGTLLDAAAAPSPSAPDDETPILSVPVRLRRCGRETTMLIDGTDPLATAKLSVLRPGKLKAGRGKLSTPVPGTK